MQHQSFDTLPESVVCHILGLVALDAAVASVRCTSRGFQTHMDTVVIRRVELTRRHDPCNDDVTVNLSTMRTLLGRITRLTGLTTCHNEVLQSASLSLRRLCLNVRIPDLLLVSRFHGLTQLLMKGCVSVTDISPLTSCVRLHTLVITNLENPEMLCGLSDVSPIALMPVLTSLSFVRCQMLTDIRPISSCTALTSLSLASCTMLSDISPLSTCVRLQCLDLSHSRCDIPRGSRDVSALSGMTQLHTLSLQCNALLTDIGPLVRCTSLTSLDMSNCRALRTLPALQALCHLSTLSIQCCYKINHVVSLPPSINKLRLSRLILPSAMSSLIGLQVLSMTECQHIPDVAVLSHLTSMTMLSLRDLRTRVDLAPLSSCTVLADVNIYFHFVVAAEDPPLDLRPLATLHELHGLKLANCPDIVDLSPFAAGCPKLRRIILLHCPGILDPHCMDGLTGCVVIDA